MNSKDAVEALLSIEPSLRRLIRSVLLDASSEDDVFQETLIAASRLEVSEEKSLGAWFSRTAKNFARMNNRTQARRRAREKLAARSELLEQDPLGTGVLPLELLSAIYALPHTEQRILVLRYFEGNAILEIARLVGVNRNTVAKKLAKALERLRKSFRLRQQSTTQHAQCSQAASERLFCFFAENPSLAHVCNRAETDGRTRQATNFATLRGMLSRVLGQTASNAIKILAGEPWPPARSLGLWLWLHVQRKPGVAQFQSWKQALPDLGINDLANNARLDTLICGHAQNMTLLAKESVLAEIARLTSADGFHRDVRLELAHIGARLTLSNILVLLRDFDRATNALDGVEDFCHARGFEYLAHEERYFRGLLQRVRGDYRAAISTLTAPPSDSTLDLMGQPNLRYRLHCQALSAASRLRDKSSALASISVCENIESDANNVPLTEKARFRSVAAGFWADLGDMKRARELFAEARRGYEHSHFWSGFTSLSSSEMIHALNSRSYAWFADAADALIRASLKAQHMPILGRYSFLKHCAIEVTPKWNPRLIRLSDSTAVANNPNLVTGAITVSSRHLLARSIRTTGFDSDLVEVVNESCTPGIYESWLVSEGGQGPVRALFEDAVTPDSS